MTSAVCEEHVTFNSGPLRLAGILAYPEDSMPRRAVLLCSPHPHFAGDMHNNVIRAIADRLAQSCVVLRFDYRGVGNSQIELEPTQSTFDYWANMEKKHDSTDAVNDVTAAAAALLDAVGSVDVELSVVGYSFGAAVGMLFARNEPGVRRIAAVAPPLGRVSFDFMAGSDRNGLHLIGKNDFLYSEEQVGAYRQLLGPTAEVVVLDGADHFFRGCEDIPAARIDAFVTDKNCDQQEQ